MSDDLSQAKHLEEGITEKGENKAIPTQKKETKLKYKMRMLKEMAAKNYEKNVKDN